MSGVPRKLDSAGDLLGRGLRPGPVRTLYLGLIAFLLFLFPFGLVFIAGRVLPAQFSWTASIIIVLTAIATLLSQFRYESPARALGTFLVLAGILFLVEFAGMTTGFPFGRYVYTDALGGLVAGVPVAMAFAWYGTVVNSWHIARRITASGTRVSVWVIAGVGGLLTVLLDLALEPMAALVTRYWVWEGDRVPLQNYAAWFVIAFLATFTLESRRDRSRPVCDGAFLSSLLLYLMQWVLFFLTGLAAGYVVPVVLSLAGLLALLLPRRAAIRSMLLSGSDAR